MQSVSTSSMSPSGSKRETGGVAAWLIAAGVVDVVTSNVLALALVEWRLGRSSHSRLALVVSVLSVGRCVALVVGAAARRARGALGAVAACSAAALAFAGAPRGALEMASVATTCVLSAAGAAWLARARRQERGAEASDLEEALLEERSSGGSVVSGGREGKKSRHGWWRLIELSRPEWCQMGCATVALVLGLLCQLALPSLFGSMIDAIADDDKSHARQRELLLRAFSELLVLLSLSLVFTAIRSYVFNVSGEKVVARVRRRLFGAMLSQELAWFDRSRTGDLMNRLSSDTTKLQSAATESVSMLLRSVASAILSLALLFATSWFLALVTLAVVPLMIGVAVVSATAIKKLSERYQAALAAAATVAQEVLSNIRVVRSFAADEFELERYARAVGDPLAPWAAEKATNSSYAIGVQRAAVTAVFVSLMMAFGFASCIVVLYVGGTLVIRGEMRVGSLISFIMYLINIAESLGVLAGLMASVQDAIGASVVVFDIIDRVPEQRTDGDGTASLAAGRRAASCAFVDVHFTYPTRPDVQVLKGVSLDIRAGMRAALCGPSGSGKSTTLALIERFYDADAGTVLLDGVDVTRLPVPVLRDHLALVAQEPALFSGTIADNIAYARLTRRRPFRRDEIAAIAAAAHVDAFVKTFPDGYDTVVGERGVKLSGGQKQRVAIARALFADPRLLLLDEATSALDAESEALVQAAIERLVENRTSLTIAHRLSTVVDADLIAVIVEGACVGVGTHASLLRDCAQYQALVRKQLASSSSDAALVALDKHNPP